MQLIAFPEPEQSLRALSREYPDGHCVAEHWHEGAQLIYAVSGVMELSCADGLWLISPQQALWMPPRLRHRLRARGPVSLRSLYLRDPACPPGLPAVPASLGVTPLLRELLCRACSLPPAAAWSARERRLLQVLLDEIAWAQACPLRLPMPRDPRLQRLCLGLLAQPGDPRGLEQWGRQVGASSRTLARLFQAELGMGFMLWRQQARVFAALPRLSAGEPVTRVAAELGYETAGAFSAAFRKLMGCAPRDYR